MGCVSLSPEPATEIEIKNTTKDAGEHLMMPSSGATMLAAVELGSEQRGDLCGNSIKNIPAMMDKGGGGTTAVTSAGGRDESSQNSVGGGGSTGSKSSNWRPTEEQVQKYCEFLGMDPIKDSHLKYIAAHALTAPIPPPWKEFETHDGYVYYVNSVTGKSSWEHPLDGFYRKMYKDEKRGVAGGGGDEKGDKQSNTSGSSDTSTSSRDGADTTTKAADAKQEALHKARLEEIKDLKTQLEALRKKQHEGKTERKALQDKNAQLARAHSEELQALNQAHKRQLEGIKQQHSKAQMALNDRRDAEQKVVYELEQQVIELTEQNNALAEEKAAQSAKHTAEIEARDEQIAALNKRVEAAEDAASSRESDTAKKMEETGKEMEGLRGMISQLKDANHELASSLETAHKSRDEAKEALVAATEENKKMAVELEAETAKVETLENQVQADRKLLERLDMRYIAKEKEHEATLKALKELEGKTAVISSEREMATRRLKALEEVSSKGLDKDHDKAIEEFAKLSVQCLEMADEAKDRVVELERTQRELTNLQANVGKIEAERRDALNQLQELKGNIRVMCRVRPLLHRERRSSIYALKLSQKSIHCHPSMGRIEIRDPAGRDKMPNEFKFNHVFQDASQDEVFGEVSTLVQSALDGYNVCLFAYGQTGSGKTFTMMGEEGKDQGIIPRAVSKILEVAKLKQVQGWDFEIRGSFLEIYNEAVRDLLVTDSNNLEIKIKQGASSSRQTYVSGLKLFQIKTQEDVTNIMDTAAKNRSVASTDMNMHSSRSHSVFTLHMRGVNRKLKMETKSALYLCDLAGSERIDKSGVEGARLKEAVSINRSLSALSDVFQALARGDSHVPFRNSKLTYLLQCCFVGNGKTLMFVNLSPNPTSTQESLCSLRFAQKVNKCVMGPAQAQTSRLKESSSNGGAAGGGGNSANSPASTKSSRKSSGKSSTRSPNSKRSTTTTRLARPPPGAPRFARSSKGRTSTGRRK